MTRTPLLDRRRVGALHVLVLRPDDDARAPVVDASCALLAQLRELLDGDDDVRVAVVATARGGDRWARADDAALAEVARGVAQALTLEYGARLRINAVLARRLDDAVTPTLDYLASPGASYVAGATFDLRARA